MSDLYEAYRDYYQIERHSQCPICRNFELVRTLACQEQDPAQARETEGK